MSLPPPGRPRFAAALPLGSAAVVMLVALARPGDHAHRRRPPWRVRSTASLATRRQPGLQARPRRTRPSVRRPRRWRTLHGQLERLSTATTARQADSTAHNYKRDDPAHQRPGHPDRRCSATPPLRDRRRRPATTSPSPTRA
ncbi:MAG: hypothetical protein MZW92_55555 [Comamonadaceae bacterium]|nr:hypothetical protein [Comamonadaceae bacterium]